jgi:putative membrane protein
MRLILSIAINGIAIAMMAWLLPGISVTPHTWLTFALLGLVIGVVNGIIRPVINALTFPVTILTLGLWHLVVNALLLLGVAWALPGTLHIAGFWSAFWGGILMGIVGGILEWGRKQWQRDHHRRAAKRRLAAHIGAPAGGSR